MASLLYFVSGNTVDPERGIQIFFGLTKLILQRIQSLTKKNYKSLDLFSTHHHRVGEFGGMCFNIGAISNELLNE